jgi:hypothetical protein
VVGFYWVRFRDAVAGLMRGTNRLIDVVAVAAFFVLLFNHQIGQWLGNWHGFSAWWAFAVPGVLFLYAVAHGHYERTTAQNDALTSLTGEVTGLQTHLDGLQQQVAQTQGGGMTAIHAEHSSGIDVKGIQMISGTRSPAVNRGPALDPTELHRRTMELAGRIRQFLIAREADSKAAAEAPIPHGQQGWFEQMRREQAREEVHREESARQLTHRFAGELKFLGGELEARGAAESWDFEVHSAWRLAEIPTTLEAAGHRLAAEYGIAALPPSPPPKELEGPDEGGQE